MALTKISGNEIDNATVITTQSISVSGVSTVGSLSIGATSVISSARQLQNIASLDATTTATIESAISNAPNTFTDLSISGVSTFVNGPVLIGSGTSTGTVGQVLQATGGAYVSGNLGIGTTNPQYKLDVLGAIFGNSTITGTQLISNIATGTAPFAVTSTTQVSNLNVQYLNGYSSDTANTANAIARRDASGNFSAGTITAALTGNVTGNVTGSSGSCTGNAATVTTNANLTGDVTSVGNATAIAAGVIVDADINASAAIADTKLATIATAGKVSNSATTATSANTASAIVARDASGNFSAGTITAAALTVSGDLTVNGTTTTINSTTLSVDDKNIELGSVATPTDVTADGGGITLKGTTDKTFNWASSTSAWTSSEDLNLATDKVYEIAGTTVLSASQVLGKSMPSGSVVGTTDIQTLTNKTIVASSNTISGLTNSNLSGTAGITNANLANYTISGVALGSNLNTLTMGVSGTGLSGSTTYNGSGAATFTVTSNATNANTASAIVARDASGNFSAGTITAALTGNVTGNVTGSSGSCTGNAATATNVAYSGLTGTVPTWNQNTTGSSASVANALTFNNGGAGAASGTTFNGSAAQTISYNTLGASPLAGSSSLTTTGTVTSGTWSGSFGAVSGANLTGLTAGNLSGTIPSGVLGNSTHYIGTTAITLNRASAAQSLTGITSIDGSSASCTGNAATATTASACSGNSATATTASNLTGLTLNSSAAAINPDNVTQNQLGYNNSVSLFGQTDGGLYSSAYSSSWIHQIYGDFRTGQIAIRGKNSGTWQAWRTVLDSSNYTSYVGNGTLTLAVSGTGLSGSASFTANQSGATTFTVTSNATSANTASAIVARDGNGDFTGRYISSSYFNSSDDISAGTITYLMGKFGDNYYRSATAAKVAAFISGQTMNISGSSTSCSGNAATATTATNQSGGTVSATTGSFSSTVTSYSYQGNGNVGGTGSASWHPSGIYSAGFNWLYGGINAGGSSVTNMGDARANIFYDYNNTAYYTDPASTSILNTIGFNGTSANAFGSYWAGSSGYPAYQFTGGNSRFGFSSTGGVVDVYADGNFYATDSTYLVLHTGNYTSYAMPIGSSATNSVDLRAPIFYDSANTAYYCDPNSTSYLYHLTLSGASYFRPSTWIQMDGSYGMYWPNTNGAHIEANTLSTYGSIAIRGTRGGWRGIHFYEGGNTPHLMFDSSANGGIYYETGGRWGQYYSYGNNCWGFGTSTTNSAYNIYCPTGVYSGGRIDGTIFYDSNNTAYYLDPASTSYVNSLQTNGSLTVGNSTSSDIYMTDSDEGSRRIHCNSNRIGFLNQDTNWGSYCNDDGSWVAETISYANASHRAPIFYDSNNTGYYVDPNSTSNLNGLTAGTTTLGDTRINFVSGSGGHTFSASHYSMGKDIANTGWSHPHYSDLIIGYHTGIRLGAAYSGIRFYSNSPTTDANNDGNGDGGESLLMTIGGYVGNSGQDVNVNNILYAGASMRAPIFYDSNNTGYYTDPASTSTLNALTLNSTFTVNNAWSYVANNYGYGIVGLYTSTVFQLVFAMGDAYKTTAGGGISNLYGIAWSHPNAGGIAANLNTHGALITENGTFLAALSGSIRCRDDMRAPLYYDNNNTGYYTDPASTSNLNNVQVLTFGVGTAASGTTGEIRATNNVTAYYSDERLKENITTISSALSKLLTLRGVTFNSNEVAEQYGYTDKKEQVGVIAQDVEKVLPQVVVPAPFDIAQDEDGNEYSKSGENYKTVHYDKLVPLLIEAIKELKGEIEELKSKIPV